MEQRMLFIEAAGREGANIRELCRVYGISPTTAYKWLERTRVDGLGGLSERSRRPHRSPRQTLAGVEAAVVGVRLEHPSWGGRKIHRVLAWQGLEGVPHPNTITGILHRHGLIAAEASAQRRPFKRFERAVPNELWQMDFKGDFEVGGRRCHPLTAIDDHSRFALIVQACTDQRRSTVEPILVSAFRRYGLPQGILVDNGAPWGKDFEHPHTQLTAWLMRLGVAPCHGRPYHPQTRGKNERFHRTLKDEVVDRYACTDMAELQVRFDAWRDLYNNARPHQGIGDQVPASRFREAPRPFPEWLADIAYGPDGIVRKVQSDGRISFMGRSVFISAAFARQPIALRATSTDGVFEVRYCAFTVASLDLREGSSDGHPTVHHVRVHPSTISAC
jgi:transposase InsO family protein